MDYEKKRKEEVVRATQLWEYGDITRENLEYIFPELAESEDERIRKAIIATIHLYYGEPLEDEAKDMIAWLEKQGEQKPIANVEPKFKVGDFIANDYCFGKVIEITNDAYLLDTEQGIPFSYEHNAHLWTIQDAKDGDVLASGHLVFIFKVIHGVWLNCHCSVHNDGSFIADSYDLMTNKYFSEVHPATKEQRDLLFAKMKEAGYEWDAEKKELKMLEKQGKPKWTDEDEERLQSCIIALQGKGLMGGVDTMDSKWLKSLKQRMEE